MAVSSEKARVSLDGSAETPYPAPPPLFSRLGSWLLRLPQQIAVLMIRGYQLTVSPVLPPSCRFFPSCSQYALEAVRRYGAVKGFWLGARRLLRCHPWNPGGFDPVP